MTKPVHHAERTVKKFGGVVEDYLKIHDFFDESKSCHPAMEHRMVTHHAYGIFLAEKLFGNFIVNADGRRVSVRDVGEQHIIDDLGFIPTLSDWAKQLVHAEWMNGVRRLNKSNVTLVD